MQVFLSNNNILMCGLWKSNQDYMWCKSLFLYNDPATFWSMFQLFKVFLFYSASICCIACKFFTFFTRNPDDIKFGLNIFMHLPYCVTFKAYTTKSWLKKYWTLNFVPKFDTSHMTWLNSKQLRTIFRDGEHMFKGVCEVHSGFGGKCQGMRQVMLHLDKWV